MGSPNLTCLAAASPVAGAASTRVLAHGRARDETSLLLGGLQIGPVIGHGHARVCGLDNVVILNSSEVQQGFLLNSLARLLLWLGLDGTRLVVAHIVRCQLLRLSL